ncbi:threonine synthase [Vulcanisaeta moutnovskia 768-28]|uniref:Threonine synthase n=1 Tax=Vulcanisaeta moutnovskia (strain 768-28) TaxID=985053 RepID=F0QTM2_VULM7|nr:threonine synthase [Vulcanisaeta moutnovskia]ADY01735.1 threonine synthase [Vulcanisaeta moutnovskia 768-28]
MQLKPLGKYVLKCPRCGYEVEPSPYIMRCPRCGELLDASIITEKIRIKWGELRGRGVWRYRDLLPELKNVITMSEGSTPLIRLRAYPNAYVKFEGANPTGSFKDRGMTVGVSLASSLGVRGIIVASTGNTAASAAAYSARAGIECMVVLPKGGVAKGKLGQALLHGARIVEVPGTFDNALEYVLSTVLESGSAGNASYYPLNSINQWRLEGQKTIAYEIVEEVGVPDYVFVPVGNGGNIYAIWKGFGELMELNIIDKMPKMIGVQASGAAPLVKYWRGLGEARVDKPSTVASAIRIGKPINWYRAYRAVKYSNGFFIDASDDEILMTQRVLGREGVGVEPASAASLAGYMKALREGVIDPSDNVVLIATGHALKDPDALLRDSVHTVSISSIDELKALIMGRSIIDV